MEIIISIRESLQGKDESDEGAGRRSIFFKLPLLMLCARERSAITGHVGEPHGFFCSSLELGGARIKSSARLPKMSCQLPGF